MARIIHIACPQCAGTLSMTGADRVVKCRYCGTWSLVSAPDHVPEYYLPPKLDENAARRALQALLTDPEMPDGLLQSSKFHSASLFYIPYHELSGRRLGTMTLKQRDERIPKPRTRESIYGSVAYGMSLTPPDPPLTSRASSGKATVDTRVIMGDIAKIEPAVSLPEWGLEEAEIARLRSDPAGVLKPLNRKAMQAQGRIYEPTIPPERMEKELKVQAQAILEDTTEVAETKIKLIFYPIWRVRYQFQGRLYGATVDGVTGKIMTARAPQDDQSRVLWLIATSALMSFITGKIAGGVIFSALAGGQPFEIFLVLLNFAQIVIPAGLILAVLVFFFVGMGWEQFRYPGEIVIMGKERQVVKIGRPEKTFFDKALDATTGAFNSLIKVAAQRRE